MKIELISDISTFWLSDSRDSPDHASARRGWWYQGGRPSTKRFASASGDLVPRACAGDFVAWRDTPDGALALVLLLDQFTRNLYRGTVDAYAGDPRAFEIVDHAIRRGLDRALHPVATIWLYHPFHHSEDVVEQDRGLGLLRALRERVEPGLGAPTWNEASRAGRVTATSSPASAASPIETPCSVVKALRRSWRIWPRTATVSVRGCRRVTQPAEFGGKGSPGGGTHSASASCVGSIPQLPSVCFLPPLTRQSRPTWDACSRWSRMGEHELARPPGNLSP